MITSIIQKWHQKNQKQKKMQLPWKSHQWGAHREYEAMHPRHPQIFTGGQQPIKIGQPRLYT